MENFTKIKLLAHEEISYNTTEELKSQKFRLESIIEYYKLLGIIVSVLSATAASTAFYFKDMPRDLITSISFTVIFIFSILMCALIYFYLGKIRSYSYQAKSIDCELKQRKEMEHNYEEALMFQEKFNEKLQKKLNNENHQTKNFITQKREERLKAK